MPTMFVGPADFKDLLESRQNSPNWKKERNDFSEGLCRIEG